MNIHGKYLADLLLKNQTWTDAELDIVLEGVKFLWDFAEGYGERSLTTAMILLHNNFERMKLNRRNWIDKGILPNGNKI